MLRDCLHRFLHILNLSHILLCPFKVSVALPNMDTKFAYLIHSNLYLFTLIYHFLKSNDESAENQFLILL